MLRADFVRLSIKSERKVGLFISVEVVGSEKKAKRGGGREGGILIADFIAIAPADWSPRGGRIQNEQRMQGSRKTVPCH